MSRPLASRSSQSSAETQYQVAYVRYAGRCTGDGRRASPSPRTRRGLLRRVRLALPSEKTGSELETAMGPATDESMLGMGTVFAKEVRLEKIGRFGRLT